MGCGESKQAVATANTTVITKSKSIRSDSNVNNVPAPLRNASNESVNVKEDEIPDAVLLRKEAEEPTEDGKENTLGDTENGESAEGGEGNPKTSLDNTKEGDGAGGDHTSRNLEEESNIASPKSGENDPATKNEEEGLQSEDAGNQVVTNTIIDENKASTASVGEEKTDHHVGEKESADDATSTNDTNAT